MKTTPYPVNTTNQHGGHQKPIFLQDQRVGNEPIETADRTQILNDQLQFAGSNTESMVVLARVKSTTMASAKPHHIGWINC